jgi:hypothetical protein
MIKRNRPRAVKAKRLEPTKETVRELFVKSGNECAFPGCTHRIINQEGVFIAEMCHIEAAEKGGHRFNPDMSNEDRRHFSNLMLMCHAHHKITDNAEKYPVARLKKMKKKHEATYTKAADKILKAIVDDAIKNVPKKPRSLARFDALFDRADNDKRIKKDCKKAITDLIARLHKVPTRTRQFLASIVRRSNEPECGISSSGSVLATEIAEACDLSYPEAASQIQILDKYRIAGLDEDTACIDLWSIGENGDWDFWSELREFCEASGISIEEVVVDLRFDLLD